MLLILLALGVSTAICCLLGKKELPPESGTITGRTAPLNSDWTGRIERYLVKPGDAVEAGDPVAVLINERLILKINRLASEVDGISRALERAEQSADEELTRRLKRLDAEIAELRMTQDGFPNHAGSQSEMVRAERLEALVTERINAAHRIREALGIRRIRRELVRSIAKLRSLKAQPVKLTVPAPVTGSVRRLLRKPGERLVPGTPFLELADQSQPYLIVEMPEPTAKRFALGDTIPLKFAGRVRSIGRVANMERISPGEESEVTASEPAKRVPNVRLEIEPGEGDWPELPLKSRVNVRTSHSDALSRRVN